MSLFACAGCKAREQEIAHLLSQLGRLHDQVESFGRAMAEIQSPGAVRRAAITPPLDPRKEPQIQREQRRRVQTLPGYEPEEQEQLEIT